MPRVSWSLTLRYFINSRQLSALARCLTITISPCHNIKFRLYFLNFFTTICPTKNLKCTLNVFLDNYYKSIVNFDFLEWVVYIYILWLEVVIITILNHASRIRIVESYLLFYDLIGSTIKRSNLSYIYTYYITLASYSSRLLFSKLSCKLFRNRKWHCIVTLDFGKQCEELEN